VNGLPASKAEQITATVIFADVIGFGRLSEETGSETAYLGVTELLRLLDGIARKHGGSVDKYLGDKLLAVFGYPVPVECAAAAACNAALEMRQRVLDYNRESAFPVPFGIRMGVNTGELVGGDIRGPVVREFHVLGDAVNVAARLNAKAPDREIWVGPRTYEAVARDFRWDVLEPLQLKGKSRPLSAYALRSTVGRASREQLGFDVRVFSTLIGRKDVLEQLHRHLAAFSASRRAGSVLLKGEAGSGKSRILAELGEADELRGMGVRQLRGTLVDRSGSGTVFAPLVAEWAGLDDEDDASLQAAALRETVEARLHGVEPGTVDRLQRLLDPGAGAPTPGDAGALALVLQSIARKRPLLLVVEDVQWLNAGSMELLVSLLERAEHQAVLFLITGRPGPEVDRLASLCEVVHLLPLSREESRLLAETALGSAADAETTELVVERGGSLPGPLLHAAFLVPALRSEREQAEQRDERTSEAERRRATVVFADITGFTAMTEQVGANRAYPVVARCLKILDDVAREHGGTVDHYLGDCVMAVFGVPRAIEDAPRAALNAAIDMRRRIREFNAAHDLAVPVDVHTGVATGLGITGDVSGPLIREFAVMGDHVDRADRLTHLAEAGQIFVDEATFRATRETFDFEDVGDFEGFGSSEAARVRELRSTAPQLRRVGRGRQVFSALVGREEPLRSLRDHLTRTAAGEGSVVHVLAEAGIGKSRLLAELRSSEEARSIRWLEGHAISTGRNLSYHPIADLLRSAAAVDDTDDDARAREKLDALTAILPEGAGDAPILLAQLMGARLRDDERQRLDSIQGDAAEKLLRAAVLQLLRAASRLQPLVIVMEDFHWADLSSVELVESLLRLSDSAPILFLNAFRPGFPETSGRVADFARQQLGGRLTELTLDPLDAAAARSMVKNLFRGACQRQSVLHRGGGAEPGRCRSRRDPRWEVPRHRATSVGDHSRHRAGGGDVARRSSGSRPEVGAPSGLGHRWDVPRGGTRGDARGRRPVRAPGGPGGRRVHRSIGPHGGGGVCVQAPADPGGHLRGPAPEEPSRASPRRRRSDRDVPERFDPGLRGHARLPFQHGA